MDGGDPLLKVFGLAVFALILFTVGVGAFTVGLYFMDSPPGFLLDGENPVESTTTVIGETTTTVEATTTIPDSGDSTTTIPESTTTVADDTTSTSSVPASTTTVRTDGFLVEGCTCSGSGKSCFDNCGIPAGYEQGIYDCVAGECYFTEISI